MMPTLSKQDAVAEASRRVTKLFRSAMPLEEACRQADRIVAEARASVAIGALERVGLSLRDYQLYEAGRFACSFSRLSPEERLRLSNEERSLTPERRLEIHRAAWRLTPKEHLLLRKPAGLL